MILIEYLEEKILPCYDSYDKGHNREHIVEVVRGAMELAQEREVDIEMVITSAYFHDLGLCQGREIHHLASAKMLRNDLFINQYFTPTQIDIIAEAIEDHRASAKSNPRSIYGEILSSADRIIKLDTIIIRSYYHSEKHYPHFTFDEHIERIHNHIVTKYGENGYLRVPILTENNRLELQKLRAKLVNETEFKSYCAEVIKNYPKISTAI
ncbi:MAG: HD domain-containing protein [bacterium]